LRAITPHANAGAGVRVFSSIGSLNAQNCFCPLISYFSDTAEIGPGRRDNKKTIDNWRDEMLF
jgi:hypothetical protein